MALDEDALICDFAETYHILNIYELDVELAATLAVGLHDDSRIKMRASGNEVDSKTLLLARIADNTALNVYAKTQDAKHGRNRPKSIVAALLAGKDNDIKSFNSGEEFEREWRRINGD